jgi:hypothetical protein
MNYLDRFITAFEKIADAQKDKVEHAKQANEDMSKHLETMLGAVKDLVNPDRGVPVPPVISPPLYGTASQPPATETAEPAPDPEPTPSTVVASGEDAEATTSPA